MIADEAEACREEEGADESLSFNCFHIDEQKQVDSHCYHESLHSASAVI
jgi:hypothetical protein